MMVPEAPTSSERVATRGSNTAQTEHGGQACGPILSLMDPIGCISLSTCGTTINILCRIAEVIAPFHTTVSKRQAPVPANLSSNKVPPSLESIARSRGIMYYEDCELQSLTNHKGIRAADVPDDCKSSSCALTLRSGQEKCSSYR